MKKIFILLSIYFCQLFFGQVKENNFELLKKLYEREIEKLEILKNSRGFWSGFYQNGKIPYYSHYEDWQLNREVEGAYERLKKGNGKELDSKIVEFNEESKRNDFVFKNSNENDYNNGKFLRLFLEILILVSTIALIIIGIWRVSKKK